MHYTRNYDFATGTTIVADQVDQEFNSIRNVLNGSIDDSNIRDASITTPKIVDGAVTTVKIADADVTYPKIDFSTIPVAIMYFAAATGAVITGPAVIVVPFDTMETNNQTIITKDSNGVFRVSETGFYTFSYALTCIDVAHANTLRVMCADDGTNYVSVSGWEQDVNFTDPRSKRNTITLKMSAGAKIKLETYTNVNTRYGYGDDSTNKYASSICLRRVG